MINFRRILVTLCLLTAVAAAAFSQSGDLAMAEKYALWAMDAIKHNRWMEAEAGLERAADFADVSSDLSYLLALCRHHLNRPKGAVLHALDLAVKTDRWRLYEKSSALLLQAETYLALKRYSFVIACVNEIPASPDTMLLHLRALKGLANVPAFLRLMTRSLDMYEHDPRFVSLLFDSVDARIPQLNERTLVDTALRRLPFLAEKDPALGYKAVPFVRNLEDSRRFVETYRALNRSHPESLAAALELGVINESVMMRDFFSYTTDHYSKTNQAENVLHLHLIRKLWSLLRNNESRDEFVRNLSAFSGVIVEDRDGDSYPESYTRYESGRLQNFDYDVDQDGLAELSLLFFTADELPQRAELEAPEDESVEHFAYHLKAEDQEKVYLEYFTYPAVKSARLNQTEYFPVYREFHFAPVDFVPVAGGDENMTDMPLYPEIVPSISRLTKRSLISFSNIIRRPSREFPEAIGAVEEIHLTDGVVNRAREVLPDGSVVSEMYFTLGEPYLQHVDLDLDGRKETRRQFLRENRLDFPGADPTDYKPVLEKSESDWDGDGMFEYGELYLEDGTIERSWDNDGDGIRETKEVKPDV